MWVIRLFMNLADSTVDAALRTSLSMERRPASTMSTCVRYGVGKSETFAVNYGFRASMVN